MKIVAWGLNDVTLSNRLHSNEGDGLIMGVFWIPWNVWGSFGGKCLKHLELQKQWM